MGQRVLMIQRPFRAATIGSGALALVGSGAAFVPGVDPMLALAFALGYGAILGCSVVGLVLASGFAATRWWLTSSALPLASLAVVAIGLGRWPEAVLRDWWVIVGASLFLIVSWLSVGCLLAVLGWWSYARHCRADTAA